MKTSRSLAIVAGASLLALMAGVAPATASASTYGQNDSYARGSVSGDQNWAGLYGGVHVGVLWGDFGGRSATYVGPNGSASNVTGGAQMGYNWQNDRIVYGGEADLSFTPIKSSTGGASFEENWTSTLRGRVGYTFGKILPYATAGLALTNTDSKYGAGSVNNTHVSYAIGFGGDYALEKNLSVRAEYLYVDVPEESDRVGGAAFKGGSGNNVIRLGANYAFR